MNFKSRLKGSVTQTLVKALLQDAGYHIIPLGVEEIIREVTSLSSAEYTELDLSDALRKMPDFFVADQDITQTWLLEVKYRKEWNDKTRRKLKREIEEQVKIWSPLFLAVFLGTATKPNNLPSHSIKVIKLAHEDDRLVCIWSDEVTRKDWDDVTWGDFRRFQDVFSDMKGQWENQTIAKALSILKSLRGLDLFE